MSSATVVALLVVVGLSLASAPSATGRTSASRAPLFSLSWLQPSPADGKTFAVAPGTKLSIELSAGGQASAVRISVNRIAAGATLTGTSGAQATATFTWTPTRAQQGTHVFVFTGRSVSDGAVTQPRALFVQVAPKTPLGAHDVVPIGTNGMYRWAYVQRPTPARSRPSTSARAVTRLSVFTSDDEVNLVLLLARTVDARGRTWYRVRLPILPNNSTGWVLAGALTNSRPVTTYLVVDRELFTATLYRRGVPVFKTLVGVGRPYWPTPAGDFYVREVLTGYNDPFYGPVAFGTSGRSAVLTDWPGGGFVGIHGTNQPQILPGRVSHGCVRVKNGPILRLLRLMPLGTPVAIR